jgi:hypothetical protein
MCTPTHNVHHECTSMHYGFNVCARGVFMGVAEKNKILLNARRVFHIFTCIFSRVGFINTRNSHVRFLNTRNSRELRELRITRFSSRNF